MATFRSIFTYPSNSTTSYIEPDYWSSDASDPTTANDGYYKRIRDLQEGTYKASLSGSSWVNTPQTIAKYTSMFNDGYYKDANISSDNLTIYDFWEMPQLVFERELVVNTISALDYNTFYDSTDLEYKIGARVTRDITEVGDGSINAWQMPFGTEYDLGWNINLNDSRYNFFTNQDAGSDNGVMQLQTAEGTDGVSNFANYYTFDTSNTINTTTYASATTSGISTSWDALGLSGFYGSILPTRSGSTKSITGSGKILSYTDDGDDEWYYYMGDTSAFSDSDVVNPLTISKDAAEFNPAIEISQIGNMTTDIYADVIDSNNIKLYSDSGLTTTLDTTTGFDLLTPNFTGWYDEFSAKVWNTSGSTISNADFYAVIGYSTTDSGYSPSPPAPEGDNIVDIGEMLITHAKRFSGQDSALHPFPILVKATSTSSGDLADWDIPTAGFRFYAGSYDYDTLAWARIHKDTVNPVGYSSYTMYTLSIYDAPTTASTGTQTVFDIHNTVDFTFAVPRASVVKRVFDDSSWATLPSSPDNVATISTNEPARYRIKSNLDAQSGFGFGNKVYKNRTGESTYANAAVYNDVYYEPGSTNPASTTNEVGADISFVQDSNGYITGVSLGINSADSHGLYVNESDMIIVPETSPDTYTPPTPTPAELEDVWDTDDEWASDGFNSAKEWPDHVTPSRAVINYSAPTIVNNSQSGVKYTRSVGHTKWRLEVEYPPMTAEDFQKFHAVAQAAHGQSTPFYFNLNHKDGNPILWKDFYDQTLSTTSPRIKDAITPGDTTLLVEGFNGEETNAFVRGEVFIDGENENGYLHTSLSGTDSNIYGEAKIRTPWPFRTAVAAGEKIYKEPVHAVVTLGSDNFEYTVDVNNYYYVNVAFDLDSWK